jgi:hypothetical protein
MEVISALEVSASEGQWQPQKSATSTNRMDFQKGAFLVIHRAITDKHDDNIKLVRFPGWMWRVPSNSTVIMSFRNS